MSLPAPCNDRPHIQLVLIRRLFSAASANHVSFTPYSGRNGQRMIWENTQNPSMKAATFAPTPAASLAARRFSKAKTIAEKLGVCPRTIFRWADDGKIARHKVNARVVLFDEAEVLALIESARVEIPA